MHMFPVLLSRIEPGTPSRRALDGTARPAPGVVRSVAEQRSPDPGPVEVGVPVAGRKCPRPLHEEVQVVLHRVPDGSMALQRTEAASACRGRRPA